MFNGKTVLQQMQSFISRYDFGMIVKKHSGDKHMKKFSCFNLLSVMIYVHSSAKKSLRDICDTLKSQINYWYHIGLKSVSRNNLSHALSKRPNQIFEALFYYMLAKLQKERGQCCDKRFRFKNPLKSIDSSTISLCLFSG